VSITAYGRTEPYLAGFGDDVAMAAGLVAREDDGVPVPCGDAIADPLTGMHAAVAALASHRLGGSRIIDVAMADVVAATVAWSPVRTLPAQRVGGAWVVEGATGRTAVADGRRRTPEAPAAPPGRDTELWRRRA
jgi:crotonobetainyl-CoA:carnitine CoA-transferase CaiB-like acyl-CoA transferase